MDYTTSIYHDENEIINCRRVNECGDIDFYGYMAHFFQELGDYLEEVDFIMEMIKMPMTAINFIFLRFIISSFINYINIMDRYLKNIIFMLQYLV